MVGVVGTAIRELAGPPCDAPSLGWLEDAFGLIAKKGEGTLNGPDDGDPGSVIEALPAASATLTDVEAGVLPLVFLLRPDKSNRCLPNGDKGGVLGVGLDDLSLSLGDKNGLGAVTTGLFFPPIANGSLAFAPGLKRGVELDGLPFRSAEGEGLPWDADETGLDFDGVVRLEASISLHCARVD